VPPEHAREFGGGLTETALNPIALAALLVASILILALPRKYLALPLLAVTFLIPVSQVIVVAGSHFYVLRIALLAGLARLTMAKASAKKTILAGGYNSIDSAFLWCTLWQAVCVVILFGTSAIVNQLGFVLDFLGAYFILRYAIQDNSDRDRALKCLAIVCCVLAVCMVVEQVKLINPFSLIGGNAATPHIREGKIRSQGVFQHELTAGAFGSTLIALFLLLWKTRRARFAAALGALAVTVITVTSNSSTSLLAYASALLAACFWPARNKMRIVRRAIVFSILGLAAVMKAPVWFVIAHIDLTGGSSGYHRALLIDQFIRHFGDWWLTGVKDMGSWGWDMWDAQNQFVSIGETGGLVAFCLFIVMIVRCFRRLGIARISVAADRKEAWCIWLIGCALFSHIVAFFGVNYFDQVRVGWLFLLALVSTLPAPARTSKTGRTPVADAVPFTFASAPKVGVTT
jgi:hypothetical protein